jgi:hypothetical protein
MKNGLVKSIGIGLTLAALAGNPLYAQSNFYKPIGYGYSATSEAEAQLKEAIALLGGELNITLSDGKYDVKGVINEIGSEGTLEGWNQVKKLVYEEVAGNDKTISDLKANKFLSQIVAKEYSRRNKGKNQKYEKP